MRSLHSTVALAALLLAAPAARPQVPAPRLGPAPRSRSASLLVFVRAIPIGRIQTTVTAGSDGWTIDSTGRLGAPMDILLRRMEIRYDTRWHPKEMLLLAVVHGRLISQDTLFANGTATVRSKGATPATEAVPADALILPNPFFGAYEALAERLISTPAGTTLHVYAAPHVQYDARVGASSTEELQTADQRISARLTHVTFLPPNHAPVPTTVLADATGHLLRFDSPEQALQVVREDIASVSTRRLLVFRPNDQQVNVPANGFSLAATLSRPPAARGPGAAARKLPAVVLVGPPGQTDRDAVTAGIPVFGELAGALADAGFAVLRYDNRGTGQSGGRPDAATVHDYAADARAAVDYLARRKDIDHKRIALLGYGEGGDIAMLTASKEKKVAALVLVATPSTTGATAILERQRRLLDGMKLSAAERQQRIAIQKKIQEAVITGKGWNGIPSAVRRQSDTPLFKSLLTFDPARVMPHIRQPVLIVQGALDQEVPAGDAAQLDRMAKARKHGGTEVGLIEVPDVNHLLVPATTGAVAEYPELTGRKVTPTASTGISRWLLKTFAARH